MATTKIAPAATVAKKIAPVAAPAAAPAAPTYMLRSYDPAIKQGWPVKAQTGNSIRAYCYTVAKKLAEQHKGGFTAAQFASALAANAAGSTYKQPSTGWGTEAKPNGAAHSHANWFVNAKQAWLVPVSK